MKGEERGRGRVWLFVGLTAVGMSAAVTALGQQAKPAGRASVPAKGAKPAGDEQDQIVVKQVRTLVSPNEPIALVNGKAITRQRLADECVARKGEEILETLIARELIDQAIHAKKLDITPAEIDQEIERVARTVAKVSKEQWLATLAKERKINPSQYARDIIYPSLALRKLATPLVQVTDEDLNEAVESYYGEKLRCRMIMFNSLEVAKQTWEELKASPGLWDKIVMERSIDQASRAVGGLLPEPISRHAYPRPVTDKAFEQLVDIDPSVQAKEEKEREKYKPKNGDLTGVIEVAPSTYVILRREDLIPAQPHDAKSPELIAQFRESIFESKLKDAVEKVYGDLMRKAGIENRLTGEVKVANDEEHPDFRVDGKVQRMSNPDAALPAVTGTKAGAGSSTSAPRTKHASPPPGVDPADVKSLEKIKKN